MERSNDDLCTPGWVLDLVREMGPIGLDPCSNPWSTVGAAYTCTKHNGTDGLLGQWESVAGLVFCNPPYSAPGPWVHKATEAKRGGAEVLMLLKHDPSTKWSALARQHMDARCDFHKRITFEGGAFKSGMMASTMIYFGLRPYLFAHTFQDVGEVRVYR